MFVRLNSALDAPFGTVAVREFPMNHLVHSGHHWAALLAVAIGVFTAMGMAF